MSGVFLCALVFIEHLKAKKIKLKCENIYITGAGMANVQTNSCVIIILGGSGKEPVTWHAGISEPTIGGVTVDGWSGKEGHKIETKFGSDGLTPESVTLSDSGTMASIDNT